MIIHFHTWKIWRDVVVDSSLQGGLAVNRTYRHCNCGRWQRRYCSLDGHFWWEESNEPDGVENLVEEKTCDWMFEDARRRENAKR